MRGGSVINDKYKDINELFSYISINDECVITKENNFYIKKYIYKVTPIILLDLCENEKERIVTIYKEFLRQVQFDFQILVINKEYNLKEYVDVDNRKDMTNQLYNDYLNDLDKKFKQEKIFESYYYIIVSLKDNSSFDVDNVDNSISILNKIGCKVERIKDEREIEKVLNSSINKEW